MVGTESAALKEEAEDRIQGISCFIACVSECTNLFFMCSNSKLFISRTRWVALMIQLEKFVGGGVVVWWGGGVVGWLTPTTYIQLAGAGSITFRTKKSYKDK